MGDCLVPLTITKLRQEYIRKDGVYERIEHFSPQSSTDRLRIKNVVVVNGKTMLTVEEEYDDPEQIGYELTGPIYYFTPDGDLLEGYPGGPFNKHKQWLKSNEAGPYVNGKTMPFYYLTGKAEGMVNEDKYTMQISADPLNVLSYNALNLITVWVKE